MSTNRIARARRLAEFAIVVRHAANGIAETMGPAASVARMPKDLRAAIQQALTAMHDARAWADAEADKETP